MYTCFRLLEVSLSPMGAALASVVPVKIFMRGTKTKKRKSRPCTEWENRTYALKKNMNTSIKISLVLNESVCDEARVWVKTVLERRF